jgi:periplasmic protein TonB
MSTADIQNPPAQPPLREENVMPTLFGDGTGLYQVRKSSFIVSFAINVGVLALMIAAASWTATHVPEIKKAVELTVPIDITHMVTPEAPPSEAPPSKDLSGGGGGGGSHDPRPATKGVLPKAAPMQLAPPSAVPPTEQPKLAVAPTVVAPPELNAIQQTGPIGDPMSNVISSIPSNGPGLGGGIGSGSGGGVGSGIGPGVGPGHGGGTGGGAYHVGAGVHAPRVIYRVDPEFSEEARQNKWQGVVILKVIISKDGKPQDVRVQRSLGMGLDEKAVEAVKQWRFAPGTKDGQPVPVEVSMEVSFRLM